MIRHQYFLIKARLFSQKEKAIRREEIRLKSSCITILYAKNIEKDGGNIFIKHYRHYLNDI
jgi:hypothetical protein